jgi:hypothetical protein
MHWWAWLAGRWPDSQNGDRVVFNEALTCIQPRSVGAAVLMLWKLQVSTRNHQPTAAARKFKPRPRGCRSELAAEERGGSMQGAGGAKNGFFSSFPYVCPEPVLAKCSFLYINGAQMPFFAGEDGGRLSLLAREELGARRAADWRVDEVVRGCRAAARQQLRGLLQRREAAEGQVHVVSEHLQRGQRGQRGQLGGGE